MNKIKKTLALIVSVLAMAAVFAGCSESSSASDASSSKADSSSSSSSSSEITGDASSSQADSSSQPDDTSSSAAQTEQTTKATEQTTTSATSKAADTTTTKPAETTTKKTTPAGTKVTRAELKAASVAAAKESDEYAKKCGWTVADEGEVINEDAEYGYWVYYHIDKNHDGKESDFVAIWKAEINRKGEIEVQMYIPMMGEDPNQLSSFTVNYNKESAFELIKKLGK